MGLDMYSYKVPAGAEISETNTAEIAYWRKFNALHGWMEDLWKSRGGEGSFNCKPVKLSAADLDRLAEDMSNKKLTPREGFFFGSQVIYPSDVKDTEKFIADARQAIADGFDVYYDSWW
jgi:hypothetical protein